MKFSCFHSLTFIGWNCWSNDFWQLSPLNLEKIKHGFKTLAAYGGIRGIDNYELWWIQEGWLVLKSLYSLFLIDSKVKTSNFVKCHFHLYIVRMGGSNYELWWVQVGWRLWNSLCSFLFLGGQLERLETLWNNLLSFVDCSYSQNGRIQFFFFCKTAGAHFS
jgi:hypothetical protein